MDGFMARRDAEGEGSEGSGPLVLVVEDEALLALDLEQILAGAGHRAAAAGDGPAALALAAAHGARLAAAVVNLGLPGDMAGQEVVRRLRALRPGLPVVVVTGRRPEAPEADLRGLGAPTARVAKPFAAEELLGRLAEVLRGRPGPDSPDRRAASRAGRRRREACLLTTDP